MVAETLKSQARTIWVSSICALLAVITLSWGKEARAAQGEDSLCVHFESKSSDVHLSLERGYSMNGTLPVTFCGLERGSRWKMRTDGAGLETRRGIFGLSSSGDPFIKGRRISTTLRNMILPGWGTRSEGDRAEGWTDMSAVLGAALLLYAEDREYRDMKDDYDGLLAAMQSAGTYEQEALLRSAAYEAGIRLNTQNGQRKRMLWLTAALYGVQAMDPLLIGGPPSWSSKAGGSVIEVKRCGAKRAKAFMLSLVKPGRGQFYQGKITRGIIYTAASAAAGYYALDRIDRYEKDSDSYEIAVAKYEKAVSLQEKEYFSDRASSLWQNLEDSRKERNLALGILAGAWFLNIVDTFWAEEPSGTHSDLTFETSPLGGALVYRF